MNNRRAIGAAIYLAVAAFMALPAEAQNAAGDPHAHDWYKDQVQGKVSQTPATGTNTGTSTPAPTVPNAANNTLNSSLGSIDKNYRGQHQWYPDDQIGLIIVAVVAGLFIFFIWFKTRKAKDNDKKPS